MSLLVDTVMRLTRSRLGPIRRLVEGSLRLYWMWREDRHVRAPLSRKLPLWWRGFRVHSATLYGLGRDHAADYLPDFNAIHRTKGLNYDRAFLDNKAALRSVLLTSGLAQTETVAMLWRGRAVVHPFSQDGQ
ncbi:MAG TPA: hypothetical protein VFM14_14160, partial [Gemmatimonadales bacterium]|nr:hypothetical protein [Gemmatimonadales bacterium]